MATPTTLGAVIRERRIELGLTQEELAERIGPTFRQSEVSRLERGRVALPRRRRLEAIAAALDLPVGELLAASGWAGAAAIAPGDARAVVGEAGTNASAGVVVAREAVSAPGPGPANVDRLRAAILESRELRARSRELLTKLNSIDWTGRRG